MRCVLHPATSSLADEDQGNTPSNSTCHPLFLRFAQGLVSCMYPASLQMHAATIALQILKHLVFLQGDF
eukprot:1156458-Pelagomonas_calceolata.AAC.16